MEELQDKFIKRLQHTPTHFVRSIIDQINWSSRLIGIKGSRGVGKTTLLLQYIKLHLNDRIHQTLYVSLDMLWFSANSLTLLIDEFEKRGGIYLFLDEVHKYPNWSQELKNAYDQYPHLKIVFTGSSLIEIINASADLSRRALVYHMQGLSFREYLSLETSHTFKSYSLEELLMNHQKIANTITSQIKPLQYFDHYLETGYYPFYKEDPSMYHFKLSGVIQMILEVELPLLRAVEYAYISKIKELLLIITQSAPFVPNVKKISERIQINRTTLLNYLYYLDEICLTNNLYKKSFGISKLQKPNKIYLENTNLMFNLSPKQADKGNLRETFFRNQVGFTNQINYADQGDFIVNNSIYFEIGGASKSKKQLIGVKQSYVVSDAIEIGYDTKIPLWLFGFLY
ncbi:MAG: ATP-binding protein [Flavobacteriaceae bacterium]|jgi:predicted AAA+ superfamily ATPase|nr:ATP-binding protein [Flavobacteriaceae bacterium]NVJ71886.1 ATP-binding protein [Flavobacteriaceae bacterium]